MLAQVGDTQLLLHRKVGCEEKTLRTAWQTSSHIIFENVSSRKVHPPTRPRLPLTSPGSLNRMALEVHYVRVKQAPRWGSGKKKKEGGKNNNRRKTEDRLQQRSRGQFVWAQITSSDTRNQTAGTWRTWLSGFLQEGGGGVRKENNKKKQKSYKKKMLVMSSALVDVTDISLSPQWFPAGRSLARSCIEESPLIRFSCLLPRRSAGSALLGRVRNLWTATFNLWNNSIWNIYALESTVWSNIHAI